MTTIDTQSPAFIAACDAFNKALQCPEYGAEIALAEAIAAWEASRPKPVTITGLPDKLRDGKPIVGWKVGIAPVGAWCYCANGKFFWRAVHTERASWSVDLIAITEPDNG